MLAKQDLNEFDARRLDGFHKEEASKIADFQSADITESMIQKLFPILKTELDKYFANEPVIHMKSLQKAGMPNVLLRLQTLHFLFDGFLRTITNHISQLCDTIVSDDNELTPQMRLMALYSIVGKNLLANTVKAFTSEEIPDNMDDKEAIRRIADLKKTIIHATRDVVYSPNLRRVGAEVGLTFSMNMMHFLVYDKKTIPLDYHALLYLWDQFDSATDLGDFVLHFADQDKGEVDGNELGSSFEVEIKNSFLIKERGFERHQHCAFFEGYLGSAEKLKK